MSGRQPTISRFIGSRALGKTIDLDVIDNDRALIKTSLAQSVRHVQTVTVPTARALAEVVRDCGIDEALALGTCEREFAAVVVADKLTTEKKASGGVVSRTKHDPKTGVGYFRFDDGPGWVLIDIDATGAVAKHFGRFNRLWTALAKTCPSLADAARVLRLSQSARLIVEGEPRFANLSAHVYVLLERQSDAPLFLERLHQLLWLNGHGYVEIGDAGQLLERSLIDVSVGSPERLIFEGSPVIVDQDAGLCVDPTLDRTLARHGIAIPCPAPLNDDERQRYLGLVDAAKAAAKRAAEEKGIAYHVKRGMPEPDARAIVRGSHKGNNILPLTTPIWFRGHGVVTARDALLDPDAYAGCDCHDPEEPSYKSKWCARFLKGDGRTKGSRDCTCHIRSHAHGGKTYQFEYDLETAAAALKTCPPHLKPQTYWSCVCRMALGDDIKKEIGRRLA